MSNIYIYVSFAWIHDTTIQFPAPQPEVPEVRLEFPRHFLVVRNPTGETSG